MSERSRHSTFLAILALAPLAVGLSGCSFVKKQDLDAQLSSMRAEMEGERRAEIAEGDQQVSRELNGRMDDLSARMDGLENALASLSEEFGARVERLEEAIRFDAPVYFGFDEDEIGPQHRAYLDRFGEIVAQYYPVSTVTVEGFTDPVGSPEYNLALGQRRADAVKDYLVQQVGLSSERVRSVSYGESAERLIAPGQHGPGEEGWENRRVALVIDHMGS